MTIEEEIEMRRSAEAFLMDVIFPRLSEEKKKEILKYQLDGMAMTGEFELAGVKYKVCCR